MRTHIVKIESETDTDNYVGPFTSYEKALAWAEDFGAKDDSAVTTIVSMDDPWEIATAQS